MPNSLKSALKSMWQKQIITDEEYKKYVEELTLQENERYWIKRDILDNVRAQVMRLEVPNGAFDAYAYREKVLGVIDENLNEVHKAPGKSCKDCANADNPVVCSWNIKDIVAEEGCEFWQRRR